MKYICLFLVLLCTHFAQAQDCSQRDFERLMAEAKRLAKAGEYDKAINKLQSAKTCQPQREAEVSAEVLRVFDLVNGERKISEQNLTKANRLIYHLNFNNEKAAWAYKNGKFAVINLNGDTLTSFIYDVPSQFKAGNSIAKVNNKMVFMNSSGKEVSPQFDFIIPATKGNYVAGNTSEYDCKLMDSKGGEIVDFNSIGEGRFKDEFAIFYRDGQFGLLDSIGNVVVEPRYDAVYNLTNGLLLVEKKGKNGYVNLNNEIVIDIKYDGASLFYCGLAVACKDKKCGIIDTSGSVVIPLEYENIGNFKDGRARVCINGKWGYLNLNNEITIPVIYDNALDFSEGLAWVEKDSLYGCIDTTGAMVILRGFSDVHFFHEGRASVQKGGKWGVIDRDGMTIVEPRYDFIGDYQEGFAAFKLDQKIGFIDKSGLVSISPQFDDCEIFKDKMAAVKKDQNWYFVDSVGDELVLPFFTERQQKRIAKERRYFVWQINPWHPIGRNAENAVKVRSNNIIEDQDSDYLFFKQKLFEITTVSGVDSAVSEIVYNYPGGDWSTFMHEMINNYRYGDTTISVSVLAYTIPLLDNRAKVRHNDLWGYVDMSSEVKIPCQFKAAEDFSEGLAAVCKDSLWGYIDTAGNEIIPFVYNLAGNFKDGMGYVQKNEKWGFINKNNEIIFPLASDQIWFITPSLFYSDVDGEKKLYKSVSEVLPNMPYIEIEKFVDGYATVKREQGWGLIDTTGREVLPCLYTLYLVDKKVVVLERFGEYGLYAPDYNINIKPAYDKIGLLDEERGWIRVQKNKKWGWVDQNGKTVIPCRFDSAAPFKNGRALVRQEPYNEFFYINTQGEMHLGY